MLFPQTVPIESFRKGIRNNGVIPGRGGDLQGFLLVILWGAL
jgi:hypothetical protein